MVSIIHLLILSRIPGVGSHRLRALVHHFGDSENVLRAGARELANVPGMSRKLAGQIAGFLRGEGGRKAAEHAERQLVKLEKLNAGIVSLWDDSYPDLLRKIFDPPAYIWMSGDLLAADRRPIAIVGTRTPTDYGKSIADEFAKAFAGLGITVVSGLARGIDTVTHAAMVKNGGRTVAVIGSGIDVPYPPENSRLMDRISHGGAIVSEYELGAQPDAMNFPRRNRIISGMSLGTIVIETDTDGGAMITAAAALEQNREVFAVPGPVRTRTSRGCNDLIRDGRAKLVESVDDVLIELRAAFPDPTQKLRKRAPAVLPEMTMFERNLYDRLPETPVHIDVIVRLQGGAVSDVLVNLLSLEFKGLVQQLPGKMFLKKEG